MARFRLVVLIIVSCVLFVACSTDDEAAIETAPTAESEEPAVESEESPVEADGALRSADEFDPFRPCLLYTSPSPRDLSTSRMPSSA